MTMSRAHDPEWERPLRRSEVASVIAGNPSTPRVPINIHFWVHPETYTANGDAVRSILSRYPEDIQICPMLMPQPCRVTHPEFPDYRWLNWNEPEIRSRGLEERVLMPDWGRLDEVIDSFPDPNFPHLFQNFPPMDERYRLGQWFFCLFERHWSLRGMTNALLDFYLHPRQVHRLYSRLTEFYLRIIERAAVEQYCDGIWTSDDLGTQTGPFFSPEVFREFFKPYYQRINHRCHELGMHAWMHACGNIEPFLEDWIDAELDVIHPIQKHTMDERYIADTYGDRIAFFCGLDVQQVIPWGTPEQVRQEVRFLMDTYWRNGKCLLTAGNGINQDCPLESLEALFQESLSYGRKVAES